MEKRKRGRPHGSVIPFSIVYPLSLRIQAPLCIFVAYKLLREKKIYWTRPEAIHFLNSPENRKKFPRYVTTETLRNYIWTMKKKKMIVDLPNQVTK